MKWLYFPLFDHRITISEHTAQELIRASRGHKVRRGNPGGSDGRRLRSFYAGAKSPQDRQRLLDAVHGGNNSKLLFYAGRLVPEKNLSLLIETLTRRDPSAFGLAIAGTGILLDRLRHECAIRGLRHIGFLGHVADRELLADYHAGADIFLHPNPREPFRIAPLEAMSSGLPLVAPNAGGVTSYANASNTWLADPAPAAFVAPNAAWHQPRGVRLQNGGRKRDCGTASLDIETIAARTYSTPGDSFGREMSNL